MLLGTYHMNNPGNDAVNITADDVLGEKRQGEIEAFVSRLEQADPDRVVVERPASATNAINEVYERYRTGEVDYDEDRTFEMEHETELASRNEVVQVGFRLADRHDHERVVPVDVPEDLSDDPAFEAFADDGPPAPKRDVPRIDEETLQESMDERLAESTVGSYHRFLNEEAALHYNDGMFDELLRFGEGTNYAGPDALARWYRRNLRMAHNVWQALDDTTERVLFLVGSGHVHVLRHLFTEFPQFCPASPLPYLPRRE